MSLSDVVAAVGAFGQEQFSAGAASRQAEVDALKAQEVADIQTIADLRAQLAAAQPVDPNQPPPGYTVLAAGMGLQAALTAGTQTAILGDAIATAPLKCPTSGVKLWFGPKGRIVKRFSNNGATRASLFVNADWTKPIQGFSITGHGQITADPGMRGNIFGVWADDIHFRDFTVPYFVGGRLGSFGGKRIDIDGVDGECDPAAQSGAGGWRVMAGGGRIANCHITSGDDVYQAVPAGNTGDPFWGMDIDGLTYDNCWGKSYSARVMVCGLQDQDNTAGALGMSSSVTNVKFNAVTGFGGGTAVNIANHSSSGRIDGVTFTGCSVDQAQTLDAKQGQPGEVWVQRVDGVGPVSNVDLGGLTITNPRPTKPLYATKGQVGPNITPPKG